MKKAEISTSMFVKIAIALMVFLVFSVWSYPKIYDIVQDINRTVPDDEFNRQKITFPKIEQAFNSPMIGFFEALSTYHVDDNTPENIYINNKKVCAQKLTSFGDFFEKYNLNIYFEENGIEDNVYFRISDFSDNKIDTKYFSSSKTLCLIDHQRHNSAIKAIVTEPKIFFEDLKITKDEKFASIDKILITTNNFRGEYDAEKFEKNAMIYVEEDDYVCLVVGDYLKDDYTNPLPLCKINSLEDVRDKIKEEIDACINLKDSMCACKLTVLDHDGLQVIIENYDSYSNITVKDNTNTLEPLKVDDFIFDFLLGSFKNINDPEPNPSQVIPQTVELNYFPEIVTLSLNANAEVLVKSSFENNLFDNTFKVDDTSVIFLKKFLPFPKSQYQVISDSEITSSNTKDKWNHFTFNKDKAGLNWCK